MYCTCATVTLLIRPTASRARFRLESDARDDATEEEAATATKKSLSPVKAEYK